MACGRSQKRPNEIRVRFSTGFVNLLFLKPNKASMYQTKIISGVENFRKRVGDWDELWAASGSHVGLHRAQPLIHFVEAFGNPDDFRVVVATQNEQWVTAIPLLLKRNRLGRLHGVSLSNEWTIQDCILDRHTASHERFHAIQSGIRELNCSTVQLPRCPLDWPSSIALIAGWKSRGSQVSIRPTFMGSQLNLTENWTAYWAGLSKNRRKKLQKGNSELAKLGTVEMETFAGNNEVLAQQFLEAALAVELESWKGESRTAILNHAPVAECFRKNAMYFARCGMLRIHLLKVAGKPIAFDLGCIANGVYTSHKVSYLKDCAEFSPGQLLTIKLIERLYDTNDARAIDFLGPISGASEPWANAQYRFGKLSLSSGTLISNLSVFTMGKLVKWIRLILPGKGARKKVAGVRN